MFYVDATTPDVSSTDIRRRVASGESIEGLVPPGVAEHIRRHRLVCSGPCRGGHVTPPRKRSSRKFPAQVQRAIDAAHDRKGSDVVVLDLRPADGFTDLLRHRDGQNTRQIQAISDAIQESLGAKGAKPAHIEGGDRAGWILLDYFDFIVHIFSPETRAFYALERLWGSAERIEVPEPAMPRPTALGIGRE